MRSYKPLELRFYDLMLAKDLHVSTAESCTGGMLSSRIINVPGASDIFNEAFVTYSNESKIKRLSVAKKTLDIYGAVSPECVKEMAENLHNLTNCDLAISISGIAGPTGGTDLKPVGTIWFGFWFNHQVESILKQFSGSRYAIRKQASDFALEHSIGLIDPDK